MRRSARHAFVFFLLLSAAADALYAVDSSLRGSVRDSAGQPVSNAAVRVVDVSKTIDRVQQTNARGEFVFDGLPQNRYTIIIEAPGLAVLRRDVVVGDQESVVDAVLELPAVSSTLTVVADLSPETRRVAGGTAVVPQRDIQESRAHTLKDVVAFVPGVIIQPRFGADESQVSIRGSGLRNNFHLRGLNLLVNGIPYQDADGFSDFESLDLAATERIQIWKGANALQYGGSAMGGAINLVTYDGASSAPVTVRLDAGSFSLLRGQIAGGGSSDRLGWFASASRSENGGYRDYSEQERTRIFGNADWRFASSTTLRFDVIHADVSEHLPGALTRSEFQTNPDAADPTNSANLWGRFYDYTRLAAQVLHSLGLHQEIGGYVFAQRRSMVHPIFQILDQEAENGGAEINYRHRGSIGGRENRLVAGLTWLKGANDEQRFVNVAGARGNLTADFEARAESWALYAEDQMELTPAVTLSIGARADSARRTFEDQLLGDGDRSDERTFSSVSPRLGVLYAMRGGAQWFANVSRSYEPPLLLELTSFGAPGFLDLDAQSTWQYEIGARGTRNTSHWEISVYQADIDDEIINLNVRPFPNAPFTVPSYRGVDRTRHRGVEAGFGTIVTRGLVRADDAVRVRAAYTWSDFRFVDDVQFGDNYLPGAAPHLVRAEARYETQRWWLAPNVDWSPAEFYADSANQVAVDPYAVLNVRAGFGWRQIETYAELSNVTDERYSASVQVDSATGRFFEPGQPRTFSIGLRWTGGSR